MAENTLLQRCNFCQRYFPDLEEVEVQERPDQVAVKAYVCHKCLDDLDRGVVKQL